MVPAVLGRPVVTRSWLGSGEFEDFISFEVATQQMITDAAQRVNGTGELVTLASMYWGFFESPYCYARLYAYSQAYFDVCFNTHKLYGETYSTKDYYAIRVYGTAFSTSSTFGLAGAYVRAQQSSQSAAMSWVDWSPPSDTTGSCSSYTLNVSAFGVGLAWSHTRCEQWKIYKSNPAVDFRNEWLATGVSYPGVTNSSRQVALAQTISVPQWGYPVWYVTFSLRACVVNPPGGCNQVYG